MSTKQGGFIVLVLLTLSFNPILSQKKKVLSFGGNGNIGSEVMTMMIAEGDYDITIVSRGNWHFDAGVRVMPYVNSIICDRSTDAPCAGEEDCDINTLHYCKELMEVVNATEKFDVVLDFSGYEAKWIHDAIATLEDKVGVYVYVSTDSVYEVCEPKTSKRPSLETDDVRPADIKKRELLQKEDPYGHAKLAGEEALKYQREDGGFPWVALRFADVIGPRDTTYRWMLYQLWVQFYHDIEIPIYIPPKVVNMTESLTYVKDAANSIMLAIKKGPEVWDESYNIAMEEEFTLWTTIEKMAEIMGVEGIEQDNDVSDKSFHLYPSVFNGPVDISKAKRKLGFVPTKAEEAFKDTIDWYNEAFVSMESEREEMISRFVTYVVPREAKDRLYVAIDTVLQKAGVVDERYRKKKKGDIGGLEHEEL